MAGEGAPSAEPVDRPRLLVVEDDDTIAVPLEQRLAREGFEVTWVRSGAEGLAAAGSAGGRTDLVLLDLGLPDLDGAELGRRL
jgi:DNA-binding response OmpR family regulator